MPGEISDIRTMSGEDSDISGEGSDVSSVHEEDVEIQQSSRKKKAPSNRTTVFVTNLPEIDDVESVVRERLEACGNIASVKASDIKREGGKISKRVAVAFSEEREADKAALLTGILLEGRHIFISKLNQYTPSAKTVVVSNLSPDVIEEDVWKSFKDYGPISYIGFVWNSKKSIDAQIYFKDEGGAKKALQQKNKSVKKNVVSVSRPIFDITNKARDSVVVIEVSKETQKKDVEEEFAQYGSIKRIKFNRNRTSASIFYEDQKSADKAVKNSGKAEYRFKLLPDVLGLVNPLFVTGVPKDGKDVDLFLKFQECGLIHGIRQVNGTRDFIVQFKEPESVKKALALKDLSIRGCNLRVSTSVNIFNAPVEAPTSDKALKRKASQIVENESVKKASSPGKALKRKAGQTVENECVETGDNASDGAVSTSLSSKGKKKKKGTNDAVVNTSLSSKAKKKKKVTNGAGNAFSVAAM